MHTRAVVNWEETVFTVCSIFFQKIYYNINQMYIPDPNTYPNISLSLTLTKKTNLNPTILLFALIL